MIEAGEDPRFIARRLMILASEDIGLADPTALTTAVAAVIRAMDAAQADVQAGKVGAVPPALRDAHYAGAKKLGHGHDYLYAHSDPRGVVGQQYAPDDVDGATYYEPGEHGEEAAIAERLERIRAILRDRSGGESRPDGPPGRDE